MAAPAPQAQPAITTSIPTRAVLERRIRLPREEWLERRIRLPREEWLEEWHEAWREYNFQDVCIRVWSEAVAGAWPVALWYLPDCVKRHGGPAWGAHGHSSAECASRVMSAAIRQRRCDIARLIARAARLSPSCPLAPVLLECFIQHTYPIGTMLRAVYGVRPKNGYCNMQLGRFAGSH